MKKPWKCLGFNRRKLREQEDDIQRLRCKVQDLMDHFNEDTEGWYQKVLGPARYEELNAFFKSQV